MPRLGALWSFVVLVGCREKPLPAITCDSDPVASGADATLKTAARFEADTPFRRQCLEQSLVNTQNSYAKLRLARYSETEWGALKVADFRTRQVVPADLGRPVPAPDASWTRIPVGEFPASLQGLRQRGLQMFTRFPAQVEPSMIPILRQPEGYLRYGLWRTGDSIGGLVWVALPGGVFPALTCSSCHAGVGSDGQLHHGLPNHQFDLGKAKDDYTNMRSLYSTWGPGRQDIAADGKDNPVVIADLRPVRYQKYLHRTANVKNSLVNLALRVETGLITAHYDAVRPTPKDAFALAYYLWTLGEEFGLDAPLRHPARPVFQKHCAKCHEGAAHAGKSVPAEAIESPVAAMPSQARGTGTVQTTSLLGVSKRGRLLYGGEALGIEALMDPNRNQGGHYVGRTLNDVERVALRSYLESL